MAFSFEHDPHIIVVIFGKPFGATDIRTFCKRLGQSSPGNTPRAGRFTNAGKKFCVKKIHRNQVNRIR